jgi:hypothetical protein
MSDILDWLERISELFILKLLTLGAWCKAYERYRTITFTEDFLHEQSIDELVEFRDLFVRAFDDLIHAQTIDEVVSVYGMVIEELLHDQVVDESVVIQRLEEVITILLSSQFSLADKQKIVDILVKPSVELVSPQQFNVYLGSSVEFISPPQSEVSIQLKPTLEITVIG